MHTQVLLKKSLTGSDFIEHLKRVSISGQRLRGAMSNLPPASLFFHRFLDIAPGRSVQAIKDSSFPCLFPLTRRETVILFFGE